MKSNQIFRCFSAVSILLLCFACGCEPPTSDKGAEEEKPKSIIGQTTKEVFEWKPDGGQQVREEGGDKVNIINHTRQGASYAIHEIARLKVKQSLELFRATEGRYPKTHQEFMEKVFDVYVQELPMPVTSCEYHYDVENHELLVVEKKKDDER